MADHPLQHLVNTFTDHDPCEHDGADLLLVDVADRCTVEVGDGG